MFLSPGHSGRRRVARAAVARQPVVPERQHPRAVHEGGAQEAVLRGGRVRAGQRAGPAGHQEVAGRTARHPAAGQTPAAATVHATQCFIVEGNGFVLFNS